MISDSLPISLLFYRGTGVAAFLVRLGCYSTLLGPFSDVPGHVAVRIGDQVIEAVAGGVQSETYIIAKSREDLICEIPMPTRTAEQFAAAQDYAKKCIGSAYSWRDIEITIWQFLAPLLVDDFPRDFKTSTKGTICSLFAYACMVTAGCRIHPCFSPATTPNELMIHAEDYVYAIDVALEKSA